MKLMSRYDSASAEINHTSLLCSNHILTPPPEVVTDHIKYQPHYDQQLLTGATWSKFNKMQTKCCSAPI
jgi:hypothetical protein